MTPGVAVQHSQEAHLSGLNDQTGVSVGVA